MSSQNDAYSKILNAIDRGIYGPGQPLVENEVADRFGISRTPVREALQRLESQHVLVRNGRSMVVASLNYEQLTELYTVRTELEALAARLAAKHAENVEIDMLFELIAQDQKLINEPEKLVETNKHFHRQIHLASHNHYLLQMLSSVRRNMALMARSSLAVEGRSEIALQEHWELANAIKNKDEDGAAKALRHHLYEAFKTRLRTMDFDDEHQEFEF